jgi:hypothetical protein
MAVRFADPESLAQPHFIRTAAIHCFESSGMPAYLSTHEPDANEYDVELETGNVNDHTEREQGVRQFATAGPYLGARRRIRANVAEPPTVVKDVEACKDLAAADGVFTTTQMSTTPDSNGFQTTYGHTTIEPMLDRFDQCLSKRGYSVEPVKK